MNITKYSYFSLAQFCNGQQEIATATSGNKDSGPEVILKLILGAPQKQHSEQMRSLSRHHQQ
jgi:hypothetical protein